MQPNLVSLCLFLLIFSDSAFGQKSIESGDYVLGQKSIESNEQFKKYIDNFEQSRSSIGTYCVKISQLLHAAYAASEVDPTIHTSRDVTSCSLEIACDVVNDRLLAIRTLAPLLAGNRLPSKQVYLFVGTATYQLNKDGEFVECLEPRRAIPIPDALSLGAGYFPHATMHYPFHEVTRDLHSEHEDVRVGWKVETKGPIISFHRPSIDPKIGSAYHFSIDTSRDFHPVEIQHRGGKSGAEMLVQGRTKPILVKGIWLPGTVSYVSNERAFLHMELDWVSLNEPLPAGLFDPNTLERLFSTGDVNDLLRE